jgi:hypothetical protein
MENELWIQNRATGSSVPPNPEEKHHRKGQPARGLEARRLPFLSMPASDKKRKKTFAGTKGGSNKLTARDICQTWKNYFLGKDGIQNIWRLVTYVAVRFQVKCK